MNYVQRHVLSNPQAKLDFDRLLSFLNRSISHFPDKRTGKNNQYSMHDLALSAFSVFFLQCPSFLAQQEIMKKSKGESNAGNIFSIKQVPSDNHIRRSLDHINPDYLSPCFKDIFESLNDSGKISKFHFLNGQLLIAFDGTGHTSSHKLHCKNCSTKKHKTGDITFFHSAVTPVIVQPNNSNVISLPPEFIVPQDGNKKQDCERNAFNRWLNKHAKDYTEHQVTALGDDLYCNQPTILEVLEKKWHYIFVCKQGSHKSLYEWLELLNSSSSLKTITEIKFQGKKKKYYTYKYVNGVPLRKNDSINTNWCELTISDESGKQTFKTACATNHKITDENVFDIIRANRCRWKIENENNNTLKTKGYNLEHNFGHGKEHLTSVFITLNILAFLFHTVLHISDKKYILLRNSIGRRKTFFDIIRTLALLELFKSWSDLLTVIIIKLDINFEPD